MTDGYYNGAGLNISQAVHSELRSHQVAYDGSDIERAAMSGAAARQNVLDEYQKMQDYQEGADAMRQLRESASRHTERLKQALQAAPGTRESVLRQDGQLDDSKMEELYLRAQDEVEKIKPKFWSPARQARYEQEYADWESENRLRVEGLVHQHRAAGIRRAGEAALEEAEKLGDARAYQHELANQVDAGLLMEREARVKMLEFNERLERKRLAALKAEGKGKDGRILTNEMLHSLKTIVPKNETDADVTGITSSASSMIGEHELSNFESGTLEESRLVAPGLAALPSDELMAGFNTAQRLADSGSITLNPGTGLMVYKLPPSPGESTQKVAGVAAAFDGYSLADYRNSIAKVAAGYFSDERMVGMTDAQMVDALVEEVQMDGAADAWFGGDALAYKGWLKTELARMSVARGSGAVHAADRLMAGAEGRAGLTSLLEQEVTDAEISALGYGFNAVASITKGGLRDKQDKLMPAFRQAVQEYVRYRERWARELKAGGNDYKPSKDKDMAKAYKDDWQEFGKWYMKQGDLFKTRYDALAEGVRDVYRQRAVDAVATLRETGRYQLGTQVVKLDGKSDWAQEEKVLRYVLRQPLSEQELGTAKALAATKEKLHQERKNRAATYAKAAADHKELLQGKKKAIAAEKTRAKQEKKDAEDLEKVLKQADDERLAGYGRKVERKVTFGSLVKEAGEAEPAAVIVPRKMYAEAAGALGASGGGFYAFIPGVEDGIPVMSGDVETVQFNAPVLNLMDGKKDKLTGQQLRALANEGLMVPVQFSVYQKF